MNNVVIYYPINKELNDVILSDSTDLIEIPYLYTGHKTHAKYGNIDITEKEFDLIIDNFSKGASVLYDENGKPFLPMNYNHPDSQAGPDKIKLSGRIYGFKKKGDRLNAMAWFTDQAKQYIKNKEMNHISAEFAREWNDEGGKEFKWVGRGAALTPTPFLKQNQLAIAFADDFFVLCTQTKEKQTMELKEQDIKDLGLAEGKEIDGLKAIKTKADQVDGLTVKLTESETKVKALEAKVSDLEKKGLPEGMIAMKEEDVKFLKETAIRFTEYEKTESGNRVVKLIEQGIKDGKILPAQKDRAIKMATLDYAEYEAYLKDAKPVIGFKETGSGGEAPDKDGKKDKALTQAIDKLAAEKKISFSEAKKELKKTNPEMFAEY